MLGRCLSILGMCGLVASTACATMITGHNQQVPINVQPIGATVCLDGQKAGTSPMVVNLERKRPHVLVVEQEGYQPVTRALGTQVNPWIVLNFVPLVLIPGPIGLIVDISTGAVNAFDAGSFEFYLQKADATAAAPRNRAPCTPL